MSSKEDDLERLARGYPDEGPEVWKPLPGDVLVGEVLEIELRTTEYNPAVPVLTIRASDRDSEVWGLHTVLRDELRKRNVKPGNRIAIRRLENSPKGYRRYKVFKEGGERTDFDWTQVSVDGGDVDSSHLKALLENPEPSGDPDPDKTTESGDASEAEDDPDDDLPF